MTTNDTYELEHTTYVDQRPPLEDVWLSVALSLKRIADALNAVDKYGLSGSASLAQAIWDGLEKQH